VDVHAPCGEPKGIFIIHQLGGWLVFHRMKEAFAPDEFIFVEKLGPCMFRVWTWPLQPFPF
jgi:hypothetical protein